MEVWCPAAQVAFHIGDPAPDRQSAPPSDHVAFSACLRSQCCVLESGLDPLHALRPFSTNNTWCIHRIGRHSALYRMCGTPPGERVRVVGPAEPHGSAVRERIGAKPCARPAVERPAECGEQKNIRLGRARDALAGAAKGEEAEGGLAYCLGDVCVAIPRKAIRN